MACCWLPVAMTRQSRVPGYAQNSIEAEIEMAYGARQFARLVSDPSTFGQENLAFSPDGDLLVTAGCHKTLTSGGLGSCQEGHLVLWNLRTSQPVESLTISHLNSVWAMAFSPLNGWLATGACTFFDGNDCTSAVRFYDAPTGQEAGLDLAWGEGVITDLVFSPDGRRLAASGCCATGSAGQPAGQIVIWSFPAGWQPGLDTAQPVSRTILTTSDNWTSLAFSNKPASDGLSSAQLAVGNCARYDAGHNCLANQISLLDVISGSYFTPQRCPVGQPHRPGFQPR
jgi:WD40 repeat protein